MIKIILNRFFKKEPKTKSISQRSNPVAPTTPAVPAVPVDLGIFATEGDFFKLRTHPSSERLIVVFTWMGAPPGRFAFYKSLAAVKENILFLNDENNAWYQSGIPGIADTLDKVCSEITLLADKLNAKEIVTLGSSMGAYGALLYGSRLNCRCLAFSPETILNLPGSRSEKNMPESVPKRFNDLRPLLESSTMKATVITGELDTVDLFCTLHLSNLPNITIKSIAGVAHSVPEFFHRKHGIGNSIKQFILQGSLPTLPEYGELSEHPESVNKLMHANSLMSEKKFRDAADLMESLTKQHQNSDAIFHKLGSARTKLKDYRSAERLFRRAVSISPYCAEAHHQLGVSLRSLGRFDEACAQQREALKISENMPAAILHLGMSLQDSGDIYEAETTLRLGYKNNPKNMKFKEAYISCLKEAIDSRERTLQELIG